MLIVTDKKSSFFVSVIWYSGLWPVLRGSRCWVVCPVKSVEDFGVAALFGCSPVQSVSVRVALFQLPAEVAVWSQARGRLNL